eukprot:GILJ01003580.1.p1 GENE.GILJ01003580.1~~GILJ01003580.1.p1  ORF type:complete len:371 (+),score=61.12 GILJ01003580.1:130-1113(+)
MKDHHVTLNNVESDFLRKSYLKEIKLRQIWTNRYPDMNSAGSHGSNPTAMLEQKQKEMQAMRNQLAADHQKKLLAWQVNYRVLQERISEADSLRTKLADFLAKAHELERLLKAKEEQISVLASDLRSTQLSDMVSQELATMQRSVSRASSRQSSSSRRRPKTSASHHHHHRDVSDLTQLDQALKESHQAAAVAAVTLKDPLVVSVQNTTGGVGLQQPAATGSMADPVPPSPRSEASTFRPLTARSYKSHMSDDVSDTTSEYTVCSKCSNCGSMKAGKNNNKSKGRGRSTSLFKEAMALVSPRPPQQPADTFRTGSTATRATAPHPPT